MEIYDAVCTQGAVVKTRQMLWFVPTILVLPCSRLLPQIFLTWLSTVCLAIDGPMPGFKKFHQPSELPFDTANKWP